MDHQGMTELDKVRERLDYWAKLAALRKMERDASRLKVLDLEQRIKDLELENLQLAATVNRLETQHYYL